jgi:hypothetical protein
MKPVIIHVAFAQFCQRIVFTSQPPQPTPKPPFTNADKPHQPVEEIMLPYLLTFCRLVIGLVFVISFVGKVRDVGQFAATIGRFELLPRRWTKTAALLFLGGEAAVVALLILGGRLLPLAFGLATLLLFVFTLALLSALRRGIETSCNCFGTSDKPLTYYDVGRNAGFILLAATGLGMAGATGAVPTLAFIEHLFIFIIAAVFVLLWTNLSEIAALLQAA